MLRFLINIFRAPSDRDDEIKRFTRNLVKKYSRGNVSLKMGRYTTQKGHEKQRKLILQHKF